MKWLRTIVVMAVLALWLPAANHCRLEQISWLDFLSCCTHESEADTHHEDDCETDGCVTVEDGLYKTESNQVSVGAPVLLLIDLRLPVSGELTDAQAASRIRLAAVPPELPKVWQFSLRAAAPPRAPSFAS